jgi:hypothetical protein
MNMYYFSYEKKKGKRKRNESYAVWNMVIDDIMLVTN